VAGDQQSALFGQTCFHAGTAKNTYGTGCFLLLHTGNKPVVSLQRLLSTVACSGPNEHTFALEGSVFMGGAAVQWMRDSLKLFPTAADSEALATSVTSTEGVYVVPAFVGLGAPYWEPRARGAILGLTRGSNAAHIARATLESICYQTRDLVEAMERDSGVPLEELRVDGGAVANNFLMQFQADILGKPVVRPAFVETTALGAAYLAGLAVRVWKDTAALEHLWQRERTFAPVMGDSDRAKLYAGKKPSRGY
jgi:glycerol kinase